MRRSFGDFLLADGGHRDAGPAGDDVFDIVFGYNTGGGIVQVVLVAQLAQILAFLALFVGVEAGLFELLIGDRVLHPVDDELDALLDLGDFGRKRGLAQFHARAGFVDQVDGLVRQEAVRDEPGGGEDRGFDGFVGVGDGVELLVAFLDRRRGS